MMSFERWRTCGESDYNVLLDSTNAFGNYYLQDVQAVMREIKVLVLMPFVKCYHKSKITVTRSA